MDEVVKVPDLKKTVSSIDTLVESAKNASVPSISLDTLSESRSVAVVTGVETMNNVIQINVDNSAAIDQNLRIGSIFHRPGVGEILGIGKSASDEARIKDDGGEGCKMSQLIGDVCAGAPVMIQEIRIKSSNPSQLTAGLKVLSLRPDMTVDVQKIDLLGDENMSDTRENLLIIRPKKSLGWIISQNRGIEFKILEGATTSITLKVGIQSKTSLMSVV